MGFEVRTVGLEEARRKIGDLVQWVFYNQGIVQLTRNNKVVAALVPVDWVEQFVLDGHGSAE